MKKIFLLFFLCFIAKTIWSQEQLISGKVIDSLSQEPLAFVNLTINNSFEGATSDIDGNFNLHYKGKVSFLKVSFIGYEPKNVPIPANSTHLKITLQKKKLELKEVEIFPGENPAHRFIDSVYVHKTRNNPEKMHSFSYTSYNKMSFSADLGGDTLKTDTNTLKVLSFLKSQYFFLMESINKRIFLHPDKSYEKIEASHVSGFKDPLLVLLMNSIQSFSFYNEIITLSGERYVNPISSGSTSKYLFLMEDTTYVGKDTVFIISFRPFKGKNFDGLKGVLYINTNQWAIQNVVAEPYKRKGGTGIKIQQQYRFLENKQWFPSQLNTDITFNNASVNGFHILGTGRTYIQEVELDPPLKNREFSNLDVEISQEATQMPEIFWQKYRKDTLTFKERNTFKIVDSLSEEMNLEKSLKSLRVILSGKLPWGLVDLDLYSLLNVNEYEGIRVGLGLSTNDRVSKSMVLGGNVAYGFTDKTFKYGGFLKCILSQKHDVSLQLSYKKDILEAGGLSFFDDKSGLGTEIYRTAFLNMFDRFEQKSLSLQFKSLRYLTTYLSLSQVFKAPLYPMGAKDSYAGGGILNAEKYNFTEYQVGFRYAYHEKFIQNIGYKLLVETPYPVLWIQLTKGFNSKWGEVGFNRIDAKMEKSFHYAYLGTTVLSVMGGFTDCSVSLSELYGGRGSSNSLDLLAPKSFTSMKPNEFLMNRYVAVFVSHNFGSLLFKAKGFEPQPTLLLNALFGDLSKSPPQAGMSYKVPDKGFFESGLMINNLLKTSLVSLGCGAYYRLGFYASAHVGNNIGFRWSAGFSL